MRIKTYISINVLLIISELFFLKTAKISAAEETTVELEPVIITSEDKLSGARNAFIIDSKQIQSMPADSVEELLQHIQSIDINRRGPHGVQSDIKIRGGSSEQVLVLLDGVRMNDPQTSHHNMDLPVSTENIDRIEIIKGGTSSIYGANAFSGAINIVTKKPKNKKEVTIGETLGEYSLSKQLLNLHYPIGKFKNQFTFQRKESSSYKPETEFNIRTFYLKSLLESDRNKFEYILGYVDKDFGADSFYSSSYPREEEHTNTRFIKINAKIEGSKTTTIKPTIFFKRHTDKFILDRTRPSWYVNYHTSYLSGAKLGINFDYPWGNFLTETEITEEEIDSTQLGDHSRDKQTILFNMTPSINKNLILNLALRGTHYEDSIWETSPGINITYVFNPTLKLRTSFNRSFRMPSFTELYYNSPANKGNSNLNPEKNYSYEIGMDFIYKKLNNTITLFKREDEKLIDWIKEDSSDSDWEATNIGNMDTYGIEIKTEYKPKKKYISYLSLGYTYLHSNKDIGSLISKYALNYMEHQLSSGINFKFPKNIKLTTNFSYKQRLNQRHYFLLDTKLSKTKNFEKIKMEYFINTTNLLNTSYSEVDKVSMPGRWIETGITMKF